MPGTAKKDHHVASSGTIYNRVHARVLSFQLCSVTRKDCKRIVDDSVWERITEDSSAEIPFLNPTPKVLKEMKVIAFTRCHHLAEDTVIHCLLAAKVECLVGCEQPHSPQRRCTEPPHLWGYYQDQFPHSTRLWTSREYRSPFAPPLSCSCTSSRWLHKHTGEDAPTGDGSRAPPTAASLSCTRIPWS